MDSPKGRGIAPQASGSWEASPKRGGQNPDPVSGLVMSPAVRTLTKSLHLLGSVLHLLYKPDGEGGYQLPSLPQEEWACTSLNDSCGGSGKYKHTNIRPSFITNVLVIK